MADAAPNDLEKGSIMQQTTERYPAKGRDATEILVNDHRTIKGIIDELVDLTPPELWAKKFEELKRILTIHNATEENLVYPAIAKVAGDEKEASQLYHETAAADMLVFELDAALKNGSNDTFLAKLAKLRDAVHEHIDEEEKTAFLRLRESVDGAKSESLTRSVKEFRDALTFKPPSDAA
jgi:hemerythrin superfamily protein